MFDPRGNPQARNLFEIIAYLERRRTGHEIEEPVLCRAGRDEPVDVRRAAILQEVPVQIGLREANQRFSKAVMAAMTASSSRSHALWASRS